MHKIKPSFEPIAYNSPREIDDARTKISEAYHSIANQFEALAYALVEHKSSPHDIYEAVAQSRSARAKSRSAVRRFEHI